MVREAAEHAEEDKKRKAVIEAKNHADSLVYSTEKSLKEYGDKVSAEDKASIERAMADLKGVIDSEDAERDHQPHRYAGSGLDEAGRGHVQGAGRRGRRGRRRRASRAGPAARVWSMPSSRRSTTTARSRPDL